MPLTETNDLARRLRNTEFTAVADLAYLDHAANSPIPERTRRVIVERAELQANPLAQVRKREEYLADANRILGEMLHTTPDRFAYLTNVADATSAVANGIAWQAGDNVVLVEGEFPSFVLPWTHLARYGVDARFATRNTIETDLETIETLMTTARVRWSSAMSISIPATATIWPLSARWRMRTAHCSWSMRASRSGSSPSM